jgi:hypothetical protein
MEPITHLMGFVKLHSVSRRHVYLFLLESEKLDQIPYSVNVVTLVRIRNLEYSNCGVNRHGNMGMVSVEITTMHNTCYSAEP